jgi:hypothetical protein
VSLSLIKNKHKIPFVYHRCSLPSKSVYFRIACIYYNNHTTVDSSFLENKQMNQPTGRRIDKFTDNNSALMRKHDWIIGLRLGIITFELIRIFYIPGQNFCTLLYKFSFSDIWVGRTMLSSFRNRPNNWVQVIKSDRQKQMYFGLKANYYTIG